jgi:pilus assembly protein CpaF
VRAPAANPAETAVLAKPAPPPSGTPGASAAPPPARRAVEAPPLAPEPKKLQRQKSETYYDTKSQVFAALIDTIDLSQLAKLDPESAREEIRDIVNDIIAIKNFAMSIAEQEELLEDICNDVLGYGPLEPLLARDDIADIMVNGSKDVYIEVNGKVEQTGIRFRDNQQLLNICQRIVSQVGRRVDESSPRGAHHPQVQEGQADTRSAGQVRRYFAARRRDSQDHWPRPLQHRHFRRYWLGQDDAAQLPDQLYRPR